MTALRSGFISAACILLHTGFVTVATAAPFDEQAAGNSSETEGVRLHALFEREWQRALAEDPVMASDLGYRSGSRSWPDVSISAQDRSAAATAEALRELRSLNFDALSDADQLNYRLFEQECEADLTRHRLRLFLMPLNQREGIQSSSNLGRLIQFESVEDYEDWISRLRAFPRYMAGTMAVMKQGIREGMLHPKVVMERVPDQIRAQITDRPTDSLFYAPFRRFAVELSDGEQQRLREEAARAVEECILPSFRVFLDFFEKEYLPACPDEVGCSRRPNGSPMYAELARLFTTTDLTPEQIHRIGLDEVARIRAEMESIQKQVGFSGTFQEFLTHLRTDPQFYYENPNDLLEAYRECCSRIDPGLPSLFHRLPKIAYEVVPIPDQMAPDTTTAYYQPPAADGSRKGGYYVNLYRPDTRPKYEIEALSLHEAVPGHHFQIALAMELQNTPPFRKYGGYTAFIEGWGLYSEKLGEELGLYKDPYSKFGQLTYEMWRAVRLVVDTGMHDMQWTRQQAIDFFAANTAKSMLDIENEVDRYIAWPGQALAYKIGELKIRELRALAEQQLGDRFDPRDFHEVILKHGAVPLDVLESQVARWLESLR